MAAAFSAAAFSCPSVRGEVQASLFSAPDTAGAIEGTFSFTITSGSYFIPRRPHTTVSMTNPAAAPSVPHTVGSGADLAPAAICGSSPSSWQPIGATSCGGLVDVSRNDRLAEQVTGAQSYGPNRRTAVKKPRWNPKIINP